MKIKCVYNTTLNLENKWKQALNGYDFNSFDLEIGKSYTVYGITLRDGELWYYACTDFYDRLTDGLKLETKIFKKNKELMDLEFPDPTNSQTAQLGDDKWLICPNCIES